MFPHFLTVEATIRMEVWSNAHGRLSVSSVFSRLWERSRDGAPALGREETCGG